MSDAPRNPKPPGASLPILSGPPKAKDPVCGMSVDPAKAAGKVEHGGRAYYFCSKRCAERLAQELEKFLAEPGTGGMEHAHTHGHAQTHPQAPAEAHVHAPIHTDLRDMHHALPSVAPPVRTAPFSAKGA